MQRQRRRQEPLDGALGQILAHARAKVRTARRSPSACATIYRSAPREDALSFAAALSRSVTVRCAAPQTTKRSRAFTVRAESLLRDSSRRRKRRPASRNHCPSRITSVPSQKNANSSHVPPKHSGRIRGFHWTCHSGPTSSLSLNGAAVQQ